MRFEELLPAHLDAAIYGMAALIRDCTPKRAAFGGRRMLARACEILDKVEVSDWTHAEKCRMAELLLGHSCDAVNEWKKLKVPFPGRSDATMRITRTKEQHYRQIVRTARAVCAKMEDTA